MFNISIKLFAIKRTLLLIIVVLSFLNATEAQWYKYSCSIEDINNTTPEQFECLWNKATKNVRGGIITTGVGAVIYFLAGYLYKSNTIEYEGAVMIVGVGSITAIVGLSIWITGDVRKSKLKKTPGYNRMKLESMNLSPNIGINQYNGTQYFGVSLSLNF